MNILTNEEMKMIDKAIEKVRKEKLIMADIENMDFNIPDGLGNTVLEFNNE